MFKRIKKLLKNKKGDFAVMGIIVIPVLVSIAFLTIFKQMEITTSFKTVQTTVDNMMYYASKEYGDIKKDKNGNEFCDYDSFVLNGDEAIVVTDANVKEKDKLLWQFDQYISKCDSYNSLWEYEIKIENNKNQAIDKSLNENNEYLTATVVVVLPTINNEDAKYWGQAASLSGYRFDTNSTNWTGWYAENEAHWQDCITRYLTWYENNFDAWYNGGSYEKVPTGINIFKVEVTTSCL